MKFRNIYFSVFSLISVDVLSQNQSIGKTSILDSLDSKLYYADTIIKMLPEVLNNSSIEDPTKSNLSFSVLQPEFSGKLSIPILKKTLKSYIRNYVNVNVSARTVNGVIPIIENTQLSPELKTEISLCTRLLGQDEDYVRTYISFKFGNKKANYITINSDAPFSQQIVHNDFNGSYWGSSFLTVWGDLVCSFGFLIEKSNNIGSLPLTKVTDSKIIFDSASKTSRTFSQEVVGSQGIFSEVVYGTWPVEFLVFLDNKKKYALHVFSVQQYSIKHSKNPIQNVGLTFVWRMVNASEKTKANIGIRLEFRDVTVQEKRPDPLLYKVSLTVGIPLVNNKP